MRDVWARKVKERPLPNRGAVRGLLKSGQSITDYAKRVPTFKDDTDPVPYIMRDYGKGARQR